MKKKQKLPTRIEIIKKIRKPTLPPPRIIEDGKIYDRKNLKGRYE